MLSSKVQCEFYYLDIYTSGLLSVIVLQTNGYLGQKL